MSNYGKLNIKELSALAFGPVPYLLEEFIPEKSLGILVGEWGIGKSPFALQLQLSIASGIPFLGKYKIKKDNIKTLYIDLENGAHPVLWMITSISKHLGIATPDNWSVYSPNYVGRIKELQQLSEDVYVRNMLREEKFDFIVIDPLRMYKPEAESKNSEAAAMIHELRELIAEIGCSIMFIHHPRKQGADPSIQRYKLESNPTGWMANACGAASLVQNADFRIGLEQNEDGYIVLRHFLRNKGWMPAEFLDRSYDIESDEPLGYYIDNSANAVTALERSWLNDLPATFMTKDFKQISRKNNNKAVNDALKRLSDLGALKKAAYGTWIKL